MIQGQSFVYFAHEKWGGLWRNRQQLMSLFSRGNKVLYVEGRHYLKRFLTNWRQRSAGARTPQLRRINENLSVFRYPAWAPISGHFDPIFARIRRRSLAKALRRAGISKPIVWLSHPSMLDLLDEIPEPRLRIYHVVDEYAAYGLDSSGVKRVQERERAMLSHVDMVVVVSKNLYDSKQPLNPNTYMIPNGVNYDAYTAALESPELPKELAALPPPRLGYSGLVGDRLNIGMLKDLAQKNPAWSFVFLGQERVTQQAESWRALKALPNAHYLGAVPASRVPDYVKGFQVGLMPYAQDRQSNNLDPLKLYDYLAAALPVASIEIPAIAEFRSYIHVASAPEQFEQAVAAALADTSTERAQERRRVAEQHTWEARAEQLSDLIQGYLNGKSQREQKTSDRSDLTPEATDRGT